MKAMVLTAPRTLGLREVDRPKPGAGQVLVRVTNSGVCGTDLKIYDGAIPVKHPLIMGHEMVGEVVEGGSLEGRIHNGDRVLVDPSFYCGVCVNCRAGQTSLCRNGGLLGRDSNGGFSEFLVAPLTHVYPLPASVDSAKAPLIQILTTCVHAQRFVNIFPAQSAVVLGLGVAGQLHVQLAKARGAHPVIGVTRSAFKRKLAEQLGADITFSSGSEALNGVLQATNGDGADVIIECTGKLPVISEAISMVRPGGSLMLFGISTVTEGKLPFYQLYYKELTLYNSRAANGEDFPPAIDLVAKGMVKLDPLVTHQLPLSDLEKAIRLLDADEDARMKIILNHN
jgi:2-desacetyl-2-hydroxyethyl bacteriochlorophyllide A dehydrogenase